MRGPDTAAHTRCTAIKSAFSASQRIANPTSLHSENLRFTVNFYSPFPFSSFPAFLSAFFRPRDAAIDVTVTR